MIRTTSRYRGPLKGSVHYRVYPFVDRVPKTRNSSTNGDSQGSEQSDIRLADHLFPYEGCNFDRRKYLWGIYGHESQHQTNSAAYAEADCQSMKCLVVDASYRVSECAIARTMITRQDVRETGFLHTQRLKADFKKELKDFLLQRAPHRYAGFDEIVNRDRKLDRILMDYPMLVEDILDTYEEVRMVVHPVRPSWDTWTKGAVQVCTMRRIEARLEAARVESLPGIRIDH